MIHKEINWLLKEKYNNKLTKQAKKDIERLKRGEPLDYVIGFTEFLGCKIDLSKKPLIPRPETEFWAEVSIRKMSRYFHGREKHGTKVLDMFAGSGCIGIPIMRHIKNSTVIFSDNNKKFLEQIRINCRLNNIPENRYKIMKSNVFSNVKSKFDYILTNPPYIAKNRIKKIQKSVLKYEPKEALFGGEDGMFYIRKFLASAKNFLNHGGKIYMEFDSAQKNKIRKILEKYGYKNFEFEKDQYGRWRYLIVTEII